jgi:hypothetical protein
MSLFVRHWPRAANLWTWTSCDLACDPELLADSPWAEPGRSASGPPYHQFQIEPFHNSLRFKKLAGHETLWSVRVTLSIRAVGHREGDTIVWVWIGSHAEFDRRFA